MNQGADSQPPGKRFSRFGYFHMHLLNFTFSAEDLKQQQQNKQLQQQQKADSVLFTKVIVMA